MLIELSRFCLQESQSTTDAGKKKQNASHKQNPYPPFYGKV